jgi:hypothetical protein
MSRLLGFLLGSLLITVFTVAAMFFFALHYILRIGGIADCVWHGSARTWIDSNADGRVDPGEPPLQDVAIHVDDLQNQLMDINWPAATDNRGDVKLIASIPGCHDTQFEIYVDIPEGYRMTTKPRIKISPEIWSSIGAEHVYYFGFTSER